MTQLRVRPGHYHYQPSGSIDGRRIDSISPDDLAPYSLAPLSTGGYMASIGALSEQSVSKAASMDHEERTMTESGRDPIIQKLERTPESKASRTMPCRTRTLSQQLRPHDLCDMTVEISQ